MARAAAVKESGEDDSGAVRHVSSLLLIAEALCLEFVKFVVFWHVKGDPGKMSAMLHRSQAITGTFSVLRAVSPCFSLRFCRLKFQIFGFTVGKDKDCAKIFFFFLSGRRKANPPSANEIRSASMSDMLLILSFCFSVYSAASLGLFCVCVSGHQWVRTRVCLWTDKEADNSKANPQRG